MRSKVLKENYIWFAWHPRVKNLFALPVPFANFSDTNENGGGYFKFFARAGGIRNFHNACSIFWVYVTSLALVSFVSLFFFHPDSQEDSWELGADYVFLSVHFAVLPSLSRKAIRLKITLEGTGALLEGKRVPFQSIPVALFKMNCAHITYPCTHHLCTLWHNKRTLNRLQVRFVKLKHIPLKKPPMC